MHESIMHESLSLLLLLLLQLNILKLLLDSGAPISSRDKDGRTPLHWAVRKNRVRIVAFLLKSGSAVQARTKGTSETVLHKAARQGNLDMIKLLLLFNADPKQVNAWGQSALDVAIELRDEQVERKAASEQEDEVPIAGGAADQHHPEGDASQSETKENDGDDNTQGKKYVAKIAKRQDATEDPDYVAVVEALQNFDAAKEEADLQRRFLLEEEQGDGGGRAKPKLKRRSTVFNSGAAMNELDEEKLLHQSHVDRKGSGCSIM